MSEIARIAALLERTFGAKAYHGPSLLQALAPVTAALASRHPHGPQVHTIWELVTHLAAEMRYAGRLLDGSAEPWVEGETTWPATTTTDDDAWQAAMSDLREAHGGLLAQVRLMDDAMLDRVAAAIRLPLHVVLHGTIHHNVYHAGQIALLVRQSAASAP